MQIDRRITNGLAWAGAVLVVAIPAADAALRQFGPTDTPQIAVVEKQSAPAPTPPVQAPEPALAAEPDPIETATTTINPPVAKSDAVDSFLQSGKKLPSYISDGSPTARTQSEHTQTAALAPAEEEVTKPAPTPEPEPVATLPTKVVTFPTPVSQRPAPVPRSAVITQPPLVIDQPDFLVTAEDLENWESGPLSEFLARQQARAAPVPSEYDPDGFFLDEGPNSSARVNSFPRAYSYDDYAFE
ncbi:hypothetical protein [Devosia marina]|uniref:Uncharacterized protein n=1 Tax=Devosia marina TaxID=2683198 RepID=A0A7X3K3K9_9HYPH|nr:hypothetical protein [Devosia marina]MVS98734.1 hypothetical protein [Devosia marina]